MQADDLFKQALQQATIEINKVRPEDYDKPTPDTEWTVRDLLEHMLRELKWTPDLVQGKTIAEVEDHHRDDPVGDDLTGNWQVAAQRAMTAIDNADLTGPAHLSYGDVTVEEYLQEAGSDQLIHAWDLGQALGDTVQFDPGAAQTVYDLTHPKLNSMRQSGLFAAPLDVAEDADLQSRLLALYGRSTTW